MRTRRIGSLDVSVVGLGCNNFGSRLDAERSEAVILAALDQGITFFDTADIYGGTKSETFIGRALKGRRDEVVIATKFGGPVDDDPTHAGASARWIEQAVENSLQRLDTDRIDLYQLHFPDESVPMEETLTALDRLVRDGKVREIGNSNFSGAQLARADDLARELGVTRFVSAQNQYNLLARDARRDVLPECEARGLAFLPYFPLASGMLTSKYSRGEPPPPGTRLAFFPAERSERLLSERHFDQIEALEAFALDHGHSLLELAFSWLVSQPVVGSVIAGASAPEQVAANTRAASWTLSQDELAELDRLLET